LAKSAQFPPTPDERTNLGRRRERCSAIKLVHAAMTGIVAATVKSFAPSLVAEGVDGVEARGACVAPTGAAQAELDQL